MPWIHFTKPSQKEKTNSAKVLIATLQYIQENRITTSFFTNLELLQLIDCKIIDCFSIILFQ